jgi:hypothetical protein
MDSEEGIGNGEEKGREAELWVLWCLEAGRWG